jgi:Zn-dependent protease
MNYPLSDGAIWLCVFLFSTVCHEAAHAWAALKLGDATAYNGGQVTFNPIPHIRREPIGMLVVPIISWLAGGYVMGWASAPYDPEWARRHPRRLAWMALAGPGANLALALTALLLLRLGIEWQIFTAPSWLSADTLVHAAPGSVFELIGKALSVFVSLNLFLCAFNLLPIPPLDGSTLPFLALPRAMADKYFDLLSSPVLRVGGFLLLTRGLSLGFGHFCRLAAMILFPGHTYS